MQKSFTMNDHMNPDDADFMDHWDKLGQALKLHSPGLLEVSIKAIDEASKSCPPPPQQKPVSQPVVYGPLGWPPMTPGGKLSRPWQGQTLAGYPTQPSARVVKEELGHLNCVSGLVDGTSGLPIVSLTEEGIHQLNANRGQLRFVFLVPQQ